MFQPPPKSGMNLRSRSFWSHLRRRCRRLPHGSLLRPRPRSSPRATRPGAPLAPTHDALSSSEQVSFQATGTPLPFASTASIEGGGCLGSSHAKKRVLAQEGGGARDVGNVMTLFLDWGRPFPLTLLHNLCL